MSGKVIPSSTDCGRMSAAASDHLTACTADGEASAGNTRSKAKSVTVRNVEWKASAQRPITASISAYATMSLRQRGDSRLAPQAPSAMPPMKIMRTSDCAYAAWPRKSLR